MKKFPFITVHPEWNIYGWKPVREKSFDSTPAVVNDDRMSEEDLINVHVAGLEKKIAVALDGCRERLERVISRSKKPEAARAYARYRLLAADIDNLTEKLQPKKKGE